jgi:hypothetical protein
MLWVSCRVLMSALLVGVCLLGASPVAYGRVLCFERDGRVHLETAYRGVCVATPEILTSSSPDPNPVLKAEGGAHCDTCVDIPLITAAEGKQQYIVPANPVFQLQLVNSGAMVTFGTPVCTSTVSGPDPLPTFSSTSLRSTILRI